VSPGCEASAESTAADAAAAALFAQRDRGAPPSACAAASTSASNGGVDQRVERDLLGRGVRQLLSARRGHAAQEAGRALVLV
jgi:hypothetical protein